MKFQLIQSDEYSSLTPMGTFNTIKEADEKAKELVTFDNFDGPMATEESIKNWNSYYPILGKNEYFGGFYPTDSMEVITATTPKVKKNTPVTTKVGTKMHKVVDVKFSSFIGTVKTREGSNDMFAMVGDRKISKFDSNHLDGKVHYFIKVV